MVLANLFLLCWDYDKLKYILPLKHNNAASNSHQPVNRKFPTMFFVAVFATVIAVVVLIQTSYTLMPRVIIKDCRSQCDDSENPEACNTFCDCIYVEGNTYDQCTADYKAAVEQLNKK
jgi:hypothetical protein